MKNNSKSTFKSESDRQLALLLKHHLLEAPPSPWFTRKVLNRLPKRKIRIVAIVEYLLYIVGIITSATFTIRFIDTVAQSGIVTVGNVITYSLLFALFCSLCYMLITPWVQRQEQQ